MQVVKRNGQREACSFDKITQRVSKLSDGLAVDPVLLAQKVVAGVIDGISTSEIDTLAAETAAFMIPTHYHYGDLAGRIAVSNLQKNTLDSFSETMEYVHAGNQGMFSDDFMRVVRTHAQRLDAAVRHERDFVFDFFAVKTLTRTYLNKVNDVPAERPQYMWMRVAVGIHFDDVDAVVETYDAMSLRYFTHATPTLFNAGLVKPQKSSCFLLTVKDDSIEGIYDTVKQCALISKTGGGIGFSIHNVRATGAPIQGTNGHSNGILPMLQVFNATARYVDQCFAPETMVHTTRGLRRFDQVVIGDQVVTDKGTPETVTKVFKTQLEAGSPFIKLATEHHPIPIRVTGAHPILAMRRGGGGPEYVAVSDLRVGDQIGSAVPTLVQDVELLGLDDCRFYGMMLARGLPIDDVRTELKTENLDFAANYLAENGCKVLKRTEESLVFKSVVPGMFKFEPRSWFQAKETFRLHPSLHHLPLEKSKAMLQGFLETVKRSTTLMGHVSISSISGQVAFDLAYQLLRLGVLAKTTKTSVEFPLYWDTNASKDPVLFSRVTELSDCDAVSRAVSVYDLETSGPSHTYLTEIATVHNGGGKRKGSFAAYIEPWHADIEVFLGLKRNVGKEEFKARDLFYGFWTPDLFMRRVENDEDWTLFSSDSAPGLHEVWGDEFEALYHKYEDEGRGVGKIKAQTLWQAMLATEIETGTPYMCFKDNVNRVSNQQHLGTIQCSNLCTEIMQFTSKDEVAVCNLASIALPTFLRPDGEYDWEGLRLTAKMITRNLNRVIDRNYYPVPEAKVSNMKHRPIGVGIQGLADVFAANGWAFDSPEARKMDAKISEVIYHGCMDASCELAQEFGPHESYPGSPVSEGLLRMDMTPGTVCQLDWEELRARIAKHGVRNSLVTAYMPTASTAQILGNNECFEPFTSNMYSRKVLAGEFVVLNKWLVRDLEKIGAWNDGMRRAIIANAGSVQGVPGIPADLQLRYRTVWEIPQKSLVEMAAARAPFVSQSQSLNVFMKTATYGKLSSLHFAVWKSGLQNTYYLRTLSKAPPIAFTVDKPKTVTEEECLACSA